MEVEFETSDFGPFYEGGADNTYKPITSLKGTFSIIRKFIKD